MVRGAGRPLWVFDAALAVALAGLAAVELGLRGGVPVWEVVAALACVAPVAVRRVAPVPAALGVFGALVVAAVAYDWPDAFSVFAAILAVVVALGEARSIAGGAVALGLLWVAVAQDTDDLVADFAFTGVLLAMAWGAGRGVGAQRQRTAELRELAEGLERERRAGVRLAVLEERARLAGEVHDAVGHTVAGMLAQAEAAQEVIARDPERARAALGAVQASGRAAIDQLRVTLRVLRSAPPSRPLAPAGSVAPPSGAPARMASVRTGSVASSRRVGRRHRAALAEVAVLGGLVALWGVEIVWFPLPGGSRAVSVGVAAVAIAAVAVRHRAPLAVATVVAVTSLADGALGGVWDEGVSIVVALLLVVYAVGAHPVPARALVGGLAVLALVAGEELVGSEGDAMEIPSLVVILGIPWSAGWLVRRHREQAIRLAALAGQLERERRANARLAVLAERTHVARELHDTIAHGVSVMVVQAAAAEQASHQALAVARTAIAAIACTGRDVLRDLQRLLGLLELEEHAAPRVPQPSLGQLDELIAQLRDAGLPVSLRIEGVPQPVPADVATSAYRIVQEALTNVLKHAGRPPTAVVVRYVRDGLDLAIDDEGIGPPRAPNGTGHGVIGMRERATLAGGELQAGPRAAGGYSVHARLPLDGGRR
jgi:signal transduction histidine kinase